MTDSEQKIKLGTNGNGGLNLGDLVHNYSMSIMKSCNNLNDTFPDESVPQGCSKYQENEKRDSRKENTNLNPANDTFAKRGIAKRSKEIINDDAANSSDRKNSGLENGTKDEKHEDTDGSKPECEAQVSKISQESISRPTYLNENELRVLNDYLKNQTETLTDTLDEDELLSFMKKTELVARESANFHQPPSVILQSDSEDEGYDSKNYQLYQEELNYIMKNMFFRQMVNDTNASKFDKKTMNWLRKSIGLSRRTELQDTIGRRSAGSRDQTDESQDENELYLRPTKRLTRGMARTSRIRKREERESRENQGLTALLEVIEVEEANGLVLSNKDEHSGANGDLKLLIDISSGESGSSEEGAIRLKTPRKSNKRSRNERSIEDEKLMATEDIELSGIVRISKWKHEKQVSLSGYNRKLGVKISSIIVGKVNIQPQFQMSIQERHDIRRPRLYHPYSIEKNQNKKRRKSIESKNGIISRKDATEMLKVRMEAKFLPLDIANSMSGPKNHPITTYQPRKEHTDPVYASLSSKLINCLNSGGRSFARYEFFYSDIDRPWFNFNNFELDLSRLGIPTDIKLTRTEWSIVRQQIRKRPRRFSKRFISQEVERLKDYRSVVRKMQHLSMPRPKGFLFEVPCAIEVGTVVTAYSKGYNILHRGVVLEYDIDRRMYLIQFERKELGFEFCPDVEVASHGVPQLFQDYDTLSLDGTPIGCFVDRNNQHGDPSYGTCYVSSKNSKQKSRKDEVAGPVSVDEGAHQDHASQTCDGFLESAEKCNSLKEVTEQQLAIKLIEIIDLCLERKSQLLEAIDNLHYFVAAEKDSTNRRKKLPTQLDDHYAWLLANLDLTSQSLQAAMAYSQIMYTNPYKTNSSLEANKSFRAKKAAKTTFNFDCVSPDMYSSWASAILGRSQHAASLIGMESDSSNSEKKASPQSLERQKYMNGRVDKALKLLLCSNYLSTNPKLVENCDLSTEQAVDTALSVCLKDLEPLKLGGTTIETAKNSIDLSAFELQRNQALEDLLLSVRNFQTELALGT
eukprot:CAMPEP_0194207414 /NCGR_PEP_ID=MMETSP0156-20130528/6166_1 /TAXON_ID=33649 /ORGANISM="Thalassionema nitzschioides, Strain L26-B" /LENGTH=1028 /DNA_ID=CAMNT_0038934175 /DNA_START=177 /DNA_END=3263 /DNA_ORIENTATION=+